VGVEEIYKRIVRLTSALLQPYVEYMLKSNFGLPQTSALVVNFSLHCEKYSHYYRFVNPLVNPGGVGIIAPHWCALTGTILSVNNSESVRGMLFINRLQGVSAYTMPCAL
jgi:hypothetical protein